VSLHGRCPRTTGRFRKVSREGEAFLGGVRGSCVPLALINFVGLSANSQVGEMRVGGCLPDFFWETNSDFRMRRKTKRGGFLPSSCGYPLEGGVWETPARLPKEKKPAKEVPRGSRGSDPNRAHQTHKQRQKRTGAK